MATELGKYLRRLRIDNDELLKDMARKLGLASSSLSSIEAGRRNPSSSFLKKITEIYHLNEFDQQKLMEAASLSKRSVSLSLEGLPYPDQQLALAFARKFANLSEEQKDNLRGILDN